MFVVSFPAGTFQTNCYLVAASAGAEALVVDPGQDAMAGVDELCARHHLQPVAVLVTHGHLDHIWTVAPLAGVGPELRAMLPGLSLAEPDEVRELADGEVVELAGVRLVVDHTPGHTRGHVTFRTEDVLFAGDLVFAGSIGRTDLPGGSTEEMVASLAGRFLTLPDEVEVLPGHGPRTTVGRERASNPFLVGLAGAEKRP